MDVVGFHMYARVVTALSWPVAQNWGRGETDYRSTLRRAVSGWRMSEHS